MPLVQANRTSFAEGNPGRKPGSKNKVPPAALRVRILQNLGHDMESVLTKMIRSSVKSDRKWAVDQLRRMLPTEQTVGTENGQPLVIVVPKPIDDAQVEPANGDG